MDKDDFDDDLYGFSITDDSEEESSSSSAPFETKAFVLDLHNTTKENSSPGIVKTVKKVKKKKRKRSQASESSESTSNSVTPASAPATLDEQVKEEFFDAHESYYDIPATQVMTPVGAIAIAQALSDHGQDQIDTTVFAENEPKSILLESPKVPENKVLVLKSSETTALDTEPKETLPTQEQTSETPKQSNVDSNVTETKVLDATVPDTAVIDTKLLNTTELNDKVQESTPSQDQTLEAQKQPSAITKPVTGPE